MKKDLLNMNRLPTLDELKQFFKHNDWTSIKIDETDSKIFSRKLLGYTQNKIAKELGFLSNSAVSKQLANMEKRFREMLK